MFQQSHFIPGLRQLAGRLVGRSRLIRVCPPAHLPRPVPAFKFKM